MKIIWNKKINAFEDKDTGRVIAPRLDEDGIDFFFVKNKNSPVAEARYTSENYWAYGFEEADKYKDMFEEIKRRYTPEDILKLLKIKIKRR